MDYKAIEMLLDAGADVDIKDLSGITPREMGKHSSKLTAMFNKGGNRREEMVDVSSSYRFGRLRGLQMLEDLGEIDDQVGFGYLLVLVFFVFLFTLIPSQLSYLREGLDN